MLDTQQKFDLIYERLVNSVTEQEISDTWNMYSLDLKFLQMHSNMHYDTLKIIYQDILVGVNQTYNKENNNVFRNNQITKTT